MKTINDSWKTFEPMAVPPDAGTAQRIDSKRIYFAGFAGCLDLFFNEIAALPAAEAEKALVSLVKQIDGFKEAIKLGKA